MRKKSLIFHIKVKKRENLKNPSQQIIKIHKLEALLRMKINVKLFSGAENGHCFITVVSLSLISKPAEITCGKYGEFISMWFEWSGSSHFPPEVNTSLAYSVRVLHHVIPLVLLVWKRSGKPTPSEPSLGHLWEEERKRHEDNLSWEF
jgi:hypothetical protein